MIIRLPDHSFAIEIPDEWWAAAGMDGFASTRSAYRERPHDDASLPRIMLPLASIWVQARAPGVADFGRDRMISVLDGIRLDQALPPIWVEAEACGRFTHRLAHGRHRFAASVAAGFSHIPAVIVIDQFRGQPSSGTRRSM